MQKGYIYKITSPINKIYIGQTINVNRRKLKYISCKCINQPRIYNSIKKYGWSSHVFEVIDDCDFEDMNKIERYWQDYYEVIGDNGLNCILTNTLEKKLIRSKETREKISISKKGKKLSHEHKLSLKGLRKGYKHSEETKRKMSESNKRLNLGRKFSDDINKKKGRKGINHPLYSVGHSKESRLKMSISHKGKKRSSESIEKFKNSIKGKMTGEFNPASKLILNINTGVYYTSIKEAAAYSYPYISLSMIYKMIGGGCINKTNLIYV